MENRRKIYDIMGLSISKTVGNLCNPVDKLLADSLTLELYPPLEKAPAWYQKFDDHAAEMFYEKIGREDPVTGCIVWIGAHDGHGYARFRVGISIRPAHQIAMLEADILPPDDGEQYETHHTCEFPGCVNPYHCEWVTSEEHKDRHRELEFNRSYWQEYRDERS